MIFVLGGNICWMCSERILEKRMVSWVIFVLVFWFVIHLYPLSFFLNGGVWYVFIVVGLNLVRRYQYFYPVLGLIEAWRCILFLVWSLSCGKSYYCKYRFVAEIFVWFYTSLYVSNVDGGKLCFHSCEELDVVNDFIGLINFGGVFIIFGSGKLKFLIRFVNMFL